MKAKPLIALTIPAIGLITYLCWPAGETGTTGAGQAAKQNVAAAEQPAASMPESELALAIEQKGVVAEFTGNGRDRMKMMLMNKGNEARKITVPIGQIFESDVSGSVVVIRPAAVEVGPSKTREVTLRTAALKSSNRVTESSFRLSYLTVPKIEPLLKKVQQDQDISVSTIQTAVLALTDNLPLSAFSKFVLASAVLPSRFNTDAFRADTADLVSALTVLRDIGTRESTLALTIDPQLKIEAMIDPTSRPLAMRYYGIGSEREWEFWRNELLSGEPATRHYALYGIARFYPDVALEMLPRWAREPRTNPVYRLSAVQALADTQRPEALGVLATLHHELGDDTELGKAAKGAADYLDYQLAQNAAARSAVAFRTSKQNDSLSQVR